MKLQGCIVFVGGGGLKIGHQKAIFFILIIYFPLKIINFPKFGKKKPQKIPIRAIIYNFWGKKLISKRGGREKNYFSRKHTPLYKNKKRASSFR